MTTFVVNDERVNRFVTETNGMTGTTIHSSIGVERDGEIIGGVVYCDKTATNIFMHVASKKGSNWLSRAFLKLVFGWPFAMGVKRITALVPESNKHAVSFDERLGFKREALLPDIYPDGGLVVMAMRKEDCSHL